MRFARVVLGVIMAAALSWSPFAIAQTSASEPDDTQIEEAPGSDDSGNEQVDADSMEEIEVVVGPQGQSLFDLEMQRQRQLREAVFADMRLREIEEERLAWRQEDPDLENTESRIKWGYSPQAEQRMRRDNLKLHELDIDRDKPASIFRIEF